MINTGLAIALVAGVIAWYRRRRTRAAQWKYRDAVWHIDAVSPSAIAELVLAESEGEAPVCRVRFVGQARFHDVATGDAARAVYLKHHARWQAARAGALVSDAAVGRHATGP